MARRKLRLTSIEEAQRTAAKRLAKRLGLMRVAKRYEEAWATLDAARDQVSGFYDFARDLRHLETQAKRVLGWDGPDSPLAQASWSLDRQWPGWLPKPATKRQKVAERIVIGALVLADCKNVTHIASQLKLTRQDVQKFRPKWCAESLPQRKR